MAIKFILNETYITIPERSRLKLFIQNIFDLEGKAFLSLNYIFCSDEYLLGINREFLKHDTYTDIITFCLSGAKQPIIGEIYISTDRIKENANLLGITINNELHRVVFHGALHLCGYKDKKSKDKIAMTLKEDLYLSLYYG